MMHWFRPAAVALGLVAGISACLAFDPYACTDSAQCVLGGSSGVCQFGWCAYPDAQCPESGLRFDENAGDGLAGQCVDPTAGTESQATTGSASASMSQTDTVATDSNPSTSGPTTTSDPTDSDTETDTDPVGECGEPGAACCEGDVCDDGLVCQAGRCGCVVAIASGLRHNCLLKVDGSVWCWGDNASGQLGNTTNAFETTPIRVEADLGPGQEATALSAWLTTCALREDGAALCWGDNGSGQVDPIDIETPLGPRQAGFATDVTLVANGRAHTCLGRSGGVVATCFGTNTAGQITGDDPGPGPVDIPAAFEFAEMAAGSDHTCGRTATGDVYCWGSNAQGQLGADPAVVPISTTLRVVVVPPAPDLAVGRTHTCVTAGSDVRCWGENGQGQLGDGTGVSSFDPSTTAALPAGLSVAKLIGAPDHTCALMGTGELYCWGSNANGQLRLPPDNMGADQLFTLVPVEIDVEGAVIADVTGGVTHSCILTERGRVLCWGANGVGQIGDGTTAFAFDPTEVQISCP
jgi:alpha-tubulin suppressor-like RCC1 family protein